MPNIEAIGVASVLASRRATALAHPSAQPSRQYQHSPLASSIGLRSTRARCDSSAEIGFEPLATSDDGSRGRSPHRHNRQRLRARDNRKS